MVDRKIIRKTQDEKRFELHNLKPFNNVYLFSKDLDFFDEKLLRLLDLVILSKHMCLYILISWDVKIV